MSYTHLQVRSGYSFMNSTITIKRLVQRAKDLGFSALSLTDEAVLYGVIPFYKACIDAGIKPIIGMIITFKDEENSLERKMILHAKNNAGYQNLIKLSTLFQVEEERVIDIETLSYYTENLIGILPAEDSVLFQKLENNPFHEVKDYLREYENLFSDGDFYIGLRKQGKPEQMVKHYIEMFPTQTVAVADVHYLEEKNVYSFDCLQAMKHNESWNGKLSQRTKVGSHLKSKEEMKQEFVDFWPEAIEQTKEIAEKCHIKFDFSKRLLPSFPLEEGMHPDRYLKEECFRLLPNKYEEVSNEIRMRLEYELETIQSMQFSDYFLIVQDIIAYAKSNNIMVGPGRGSSAGSIVAYILGITDVDPIANELLFERFLNPERQTMPDIDIDFSDERRDEVIDYVREKYGKEHVAQIITFGTFAARSLIRELLKTMNINAQDSRFILNELPSGSNYTIVEILNNSRDLKEYIKQSKELKLLFSVAITLEGIPRHMSTHAAGIVISDTPLIEHVPLTKGSQETYLTQYAMNDLESIGLLKMDFLGLRNLSLIERIVESIKYNVDKSFTLDRINTFDEKTFAMLREGQTNGVFQLESRGMKRVLKELKPTEFEDVVAVNALFRPGPMEFIPTYIARKHGREPVEYPHPNLKFILQKTYGVLVYQEQIMQIAKDIAGFSLGEADLLRRAVSKKVPEAMIQQEKAFIKGCQENGYDRDTAEEIYSWIVRFSNYGFPRSHAVAYSKISYQLSYLKANYPAHFFAEMMMQTKGQQDKMRTYIREMQTMRIELLPPSINKSFGKYAVEQNNIRMGLYGIKGIGRDVVLEIVKVRKNKPFQNIFDFCLRVSLDIVKRKVIENLILVGAFDKTESNRARLLASLDQAIDQAELFKDFVEQENLFADQIELVEEYVEIEDFSIIKKLQDEKELLGIYVSSHPLKMYRNKLRANGYLSLNDVNKVVGTRNLKGAAVVQLIKQIRTKRGDQMAFLTLNDEYTTMEAVLFPELYRNIKRFLEEEMLLLFVGKVEERNGALQWIIDDAQPFSEDLLEDEPSQVIFIKTNKDTNQQALQIIQETANKNPGKTPIILHEAENKQTYKLSVKFNLNVKPFVISSLRAFFGKENVVISEKN